MGCILLDSVSDYNQSKLQQFGLEKMDISKQQILKNRARMRKNTLHLVLPFTIDNSAKQNLSTPISSPHQPVPNSNPQPKLNNKKRKASEDISVFENRHKTKQISFSTNFDKLFDILEILGEGAQSTVKRVREKATGNVYAVKIFMSDPELMDNLKIQYKILKTVGHQYIIKAHYLFVNPKQNTSHMVIEYSPYPSLRSHLMQELILTEEETSAIVYKVLLALRHLHSKGVSHRDIKPDNILYDPETGDIKVIDFEIAKVCRVKSVRTEMWTKTGTVQYCAPEMFQGGYTELVDVWAVGVLAFEMICGRHPFDIVYLNEIKGIIEQEPTYPESMSGFAKDFIRRCLTKNPLKRPSAKQALTCPFILTNGNNSPTPSGSAKLNQSFDQQSTVSHHSSIRCLEEEEDQFIGDDIGIRCFCSEVFD